MKNTVLISTYISYGDLHITGTNTLEEAAGDVEEVLPSHRIRSLQCYQAKPHQYKQVLNRACKIC